MKKFIITCIFVFLSISIGYAQLTVSGIMDTSFSGNAGAGDAPAFSFGFEEYANLRFQAKLRDYGAIYGAINLIAASGDYALSLASMGINPIGGNFIAAMELERLYFRLRGEQIDFDGGLMRLPFGYGQVWGSSDFLNPRNPLKPDARLRGILGAALTWYPVDELKLLIFYAAPREVLSQEGKGSFAGLSLDQHWDKASLQALYSFETPISGPEASDASPVIPAGSKFGIHRAGLSVKADIEIGLVLDALYTYNHEAMRELEFFPKEKNDPSLLDGLSFSAGADYSFLGGDLIVLTEYLYNGKKSATALGYGGSFSNNHYLYTSFTYRFSDFTNMSAALLCGFDDVSFTPIISLTHDLFQGATLTITAQVPLDRHLFYGDGKKGELGPLPPDSLQPHSPETGDILGRYGSYFNCVARLRIRF